jgi:hypothetical protein
MSAIDDRWAELSSGNERLIRLPDPRRQPGDHRIDAVPSRWTELASRGERLAEVQEQQLGRLAGARRGRCDLRQVAGAA